MNERTRLVRYEVAMRFQAPADLTQREIRDLIRTALVEPAADVVRLNDVAIRFLGRPKEQP